MSSPAVSAPLGASSAASHPRRERVPQGQCATRAYGFVIDDECLLRWCKRFYDEVYGPRALAQMSPEEAQDTIERSRAVTTMVLCRAVYRAYPNIPRLQRNMVPTDFEWIFVLKDNSCYEALHAVIDPEDVQGVQELLGVESPARWHYVNVQ